jgi:hypothetical protein
MRIETDSGAEARERRERMRKALQLLVVSGVIRPANLSTPYFGAGETVDVPPSEAPIG